MISLYIGKLGSGKTLHCVRNMYNDQRVIETYSNIKTKGLKNNHLIDSSMIIKKEIVDTKRKRDGTEVPVYEFKLNKEFWYALGEKPLNVIIDEAQTILNSRRSLSKQNQIMNNFLSLLRRVVGNREGVYGNLILVSQLNRRVDVVAREMSNSIIYHIMHFNKNCKKCFFSWTENSEIPEQLYCCPKCDSPYLKKYNHLLEVFHFETMDQFDIWESVGQRTYFKHYYIQNIEKYFKMYNTLQWDNLFDAV